MLVGVSGFVISPVEGSAYQCPWAGRDAVGPVEAGVEPLGRVGRRDLGRQHVGELVAERRRILLGVEVAVAPAPVGPASGEPVEDLAGVALGAGHRLAVRIELGAALLVDQLHTGLAEILLDQDINRDL
jgi:hypothetical protein